MPHIKTKLSLAIACLMLTQVSFAELYISPVSIGGPISSMPSSITVIKEKPVEPAMSVVADADNKQGQGGFKLVVEKLNNIDSVAPVSSVAAPAVKKEVKSSGKGVPVRIAINELMNSDEHWHIELDPKLADSKVSWLDAHDYHHAFDQIQRKSGIHISANSDTKRVGVSMSRDFAQALTNPGHQVWELVAGKTLRQNLHKWGEQAGWNIDFTQTLIDYPIDHSVRIVRSFTGVNGAVDTVLSATADRERPLVAEFYNGNNVVVVLEAGYTAKEQKATKMDD